MAQESIRDRIVHGFRKEPSDEILIYTEDLANFASEETGMKITAKKLQGVLRSYTDGNTSELDDSILDGAVALCHQVADRCFGKCLNEKDDEWQEIDINTHWKNTNHKNPKDMYVSVTVM